MSWTPKVIANVAQWGIRAFSPDDLRETTQPLGDWLAATGCTRVAIHFDVDTIDSNELVLGLGAEPGGLTSAQVRRIVGDLDAVAEVVGITVAERDHLVELVDPPPLGTKQPRMAGRRPGQAAQAGGSVTCARYSGRCSCASASRAVEVSDARRMRFTSSCSVKSPSSRSEAWMNP
jgi:arginase